MLTETVNYIKAKFVLKAVPFYPVQLYTFSLLLFQIVDLEDGILQLKEDLIYERTEARSEKRTLKKAVVSMTYIGLCSSSKFSYE